MGVIRIVRGRDIPSGSSGVSTAKWTRRVTDVDDRVTINEARNEPEAISQWHHHGENTGYVYVLRGRLRIEWGAAGRNVVELTGGDFYVISPRTIHREANPGSEDQLLIAFVVGSGVKFVNVDGPEPERGSTQKGSVRVIRGADIPVGPKSHGMSRKVADFDELVSLVKLATSRRRARRGTTTVSGPRTPMWGKGWRDSNGALSDASVPIWRRAISTSSPRTRPTERRTREQKISSWWGSIQAPARWS